MRSELMLVLAAVLLAASANGAYIRNAKRQQADKSDPPLVLDDNPQQMHDDNEAAKLDPPLVLNDEDNNDLPPFKRLNKKKQTDNNDLPPFKRLNKKQADNKDLPPFKRLNKKKQTDNNDLPPFKRLNKRQSANNENSPLKRLINTNEEVLIDDVIIRRDSMEGTDWGEKRAALKDEKYRWPATQQDGKRVVKIPYVIGSGLSSDHTKSIERAVAEYHAKTCIRWTKRNNEPDYATILGGTGCAAYLGRKSVGGEQQITLESGCQYKGKVLHEMMHTLGFLHEQNREDRDNYVTVHFDQIREPATYEQNFKKYPSKIVVPEYDYHSLLHYERTAFAKGSSPTITAKADPNMKLGNKNSFSKLDLKRINTLYGCSEASDDYENYKVTVQTAGSYWWPNGEGTDAYVYIQLKKRDGNLVSGWTDVAAGGAFDDFERGMTTVYQVTLKYVESFTDVEIKLQGNGSSDMWKIIKIMIEDPRAKITTTWTHNGWLATGTIYALTKA